MDIRLHFFNLNNLYFCPSCSYSEISKISKSIPVYKITSYSLGNKEQSDESTLKNPFPSFLRLVISYFTGTTSFDKPVNIKLNAVYSFKYVLTKPFN